MPANLKAKVKEMKIQRPIEAMKQVNAGVVRKVTPPDVDHLKALIDRAKEEGKQEAMLHLTFACLATETVLHGLDHSNRAADR